MNVFASSESPDLQTSDCYEYFISEKGASIARYNGQEEEPTIPENLGGFPVISIESNAFKKNEFLIKALLPQSIKRIGVNAFATCPNLQEVKLNEGVENIGDYAFYGCDSLEQIMIPDSVNHVGLGAFAFSKTLWSIWIGRGVNQFADNPFTGCVSLSSLQLSKDNAALTVVDGMLFDKAEQLLIAYSCGLESTECTIPSGTQAIGKSAFSRSPYLQNVEIPESVTEIGDTAFFFLHRLERSDPSWRHPCHQ